MWNKILAAVLAIGMVISMSACGSNKPDPDSLGELETTRTEGDAQQTEAQQTEAASPARQNVLYEETTENGLGITVYSDGTLLLENADVEENLKNRSVFSDYVANIKTLKLGKGVGRIGEKAFQNWDKLQNVIIGDDVKEVAYSAFSGCTTLADVAFGKNVQKVGEYAFTGCTKLKDAVLSESVTSVGDYAFSKCTALQNAVFGTNVKYMGNMIFEGCTAFTYFKTGSDIAAHSFESNNTLVTVHMEDSVKVVGERAFSGCLALNFITWSNQLHEIKSYAFSNCTKLNSITIESCDDLVIGNGAFSGCSKVKTISLPEGLTKIGEKAFEDCKELETIVLPVSLKEINYGMLQNTPKLRVLGYRGTQVQWYSSDFKKNAEWFLGAGKSSPKCEYKG